MVRRTITKAAILAFTAAVLTPPAGFANDSAPDGLSIGWASNSITPDEPVIMSGGSRARISTGVMDPLTATALVLESGREGKTVERVVLVSADLGSVHTDMLERVLEIVGQRVPEIDPGKVVINGTHTHAAVERRKDPPLVKKFAEYGIEVPLEWSWWGMDLGVKPSPGEYFEFASGRIADAIEQAFKSRKPGGVSFGLGHAVVGHNRLTAYYGGRSQMYGNTDQPDFSHVEGYEDHSVGLLYTYDADHKLTGVMVNIACPAQVNEGGTLITADYWHETREELRKRLGESLYVLPQIAAAGDQSPHILVDRRAEARMQKLAGQNRRQQIAVRIADAVTSILPYMEGHIDPNPVLAHHMEKLELTRRRISEDIVETRGRQNFEQLLAQYTKMRRELEENPKRMQKPNWYKDITPVYWRLARALRVIMRYELQQTDPTMSVPVHVIRIGDLALVTNPFELYLDYGIQIKSRSKAVQTMTVQLANGYFRYLPTERSVAGGAYGAIPESNEADPEAGRKLVERTLELIESLWAEE
ncbi:MAG: hypothetical protein RBS80_21475 [Thermoguttaceae bacterium]|jgi:hypothetical protein|nr:hypothetical protein [Thermoguttaceae bacterium]